MKNCCLAICVIFIIVMLISCTKTPEVIQDSKPPETSIKNNENETSFTGAQIQTPVIPKNIDELMQKDGELITKQDTVDLVKYLLPNAIRIMLLYSETDLNYTSDSATIEKYGFEYHEADLLQYKSIKEFKNATESIYTSEYAKDNFYIRAFEGIEGLPPWYIEYKGKLYCDDISTGYPYSWLYDTAEIIEQSTSTIKVSIKTLCFGEAVDKPSILEFIKEPDGWRLNSSV